MLIILQLYKSIIMEFYNGRFITVVHQYYQSEVNNEYVIRGNSAILKCSIPSFVSEFVQVVGWQDNQGNSFNPNEGNGTHYK